MDTVVPRRMASERAKVSALTSVFVCVAARLPWIRLLNPGTATTAKMAATATVTSSSMSVKPVVGLILRDAYTDAADAARAARRTVSADCSVRFVSPGAV